MSARHEAVLRLRLRGPGGTTAEVDAVLDTGFSGLLALSDGVATSLGLVRRQPSSAVLADGTLCHFQTYGVELEWDGAFRAVVASAIGPESLVGMGLLAGHELRVEVAPYGAVEVRPLGPPVF